jgi:hypothetical protein
MRCKNCSQVRGYPYKRGHLIAPRATTITASDPRSTWWPGERWTGSNVQPPAHGWAAGLL